MNDRIRYFWRKYWPWISPWQIFQGALAALLLILAKLVPSNLASNAGSALARSIGPLLPWHRRGMDNLAHVYPHMSAAQRRKIMRGVWDNLGRTIGEMGRIANVRERVTVSGLENLPPEGTPTILVTAHMANWEALTAFNAISKRDLMNMYRPPNNVYIDRILKLRTAGLPIRLLPKSNRVAIHLLRHLRNGGAVTLFVDQKGTNGDFLLPFLGRDAITVRTPAMLAARTGAVVVPGRMIRVNRHDLHIEVCPPIPSPAEPGADAEAALMHQINNIISGWIEDTPEQWLWIHRRWKNADAFTAQQSSGSASKPGAHQPSSA